MVRQPVITLVAIAGRMDTAISRPPVMMAARISNQDSHPAILPRPTATIVPSMAPENAMISESLTALCASLSR